MRMQRNPRGQPIAGEMFRKRSGSAKARMVTKATPFTVYYKSGDRHHSCSMKAWRAWAWNTDVSVPLKAHRAEPESI